MHFHARPLHFLTSSRLTTSSLKRGQDSLKRPDPPSDHTEEANENWNPFPPPPPPVPAQPAPSFFSMLDPRPVKGRKLQRRRGRSTSGEYAGISSARETFSVWTVTRFDTRVRERERERERMLFSNQSGRRREEYGVSITKM